MIRGAVARASKVQPLWLALLLSLSLFGCAATGVGEHPLDDPDAALPEETVDDPYDDPDDLEDPPGDTDDDDPPGNDDPPGDTNDDDPPGGDDPPGDDGPPGNSGPPGDTDDPGDEEEEFDPIHWYEPKDPIVPAAYNQWAFHPVDGMRCANGQQSGFFSNFSATSPDVVIFFMGGGICYDAPSCLTDINMVHNGMGPDPLAWFWGTGHNGNGIFDRNNGHNPFKDASYIILPHCTVDFHVGNKTSNYPTTGEIHQYGYRNVQLAMNHVVPTFADPNRKVTIAGFSAGGVGSMGNYHQIARAFESHGHLPPFLINDGGPVQRRRYFSINSHNAIRNGWNLPTTVEQWCENCASEGYHSVLESIHALHPGVRTSQICSYQDLVVVGLYTLFDAISNAAQFHWGILPPSMHPGLRDLANWAAGLPNAGENGMHRSLLYWGDRHGALTVAPITSGPDGATPWIREFLLAQLNRNDPHWTSVIAP